MVAYGVNHGLSAYAQNFGTLLYALLIYEVCFIVGFRVFHTYSGIIRKSSFTDLIHSVSSLLTGVVLICALRMLLHTGVIWKGFHFRDLLFQMALSAIGMCGLRTLAKVFMIII